MNYINASRQIRKQRNNSYTRYKTKWKPNNIQSNVHIQKKATYEVEFSQQQLLTIQSKYAGVPMTQEQIDEMLIQHAIWEYQKETEYIEFEEIKNN